MTLQDRFGRVIRTGKAEFYPNISDELLRAGAQDAEHFALLRELKLKSAVVAPLNAGGETFGAIAFVTEASRTYDAGDLAFAEDVACHAALAYRTPAFTPRLVTLCVRVTRLFKFAMTRFAPATKFFESCRTICVIPSVIFR